MKSESIPNVPKFRMSPLLARRGPIGMWRGSCTARHRPPRSPIRSSGNSSCNMISPKNLVLFCARMVSLLWESCGPRRAAHGGYAAVVAFGQFLQRSALRAPSGGLFLLGRCQGRGPSHMLSSKLGAVPAFGGTGFMTRTGAGANGA